MNLSRELYTKGIQCPKLLWLHHHNTNVLNIDKKLKFSTKEIKNNVHTLVYELFQNGVTIPLLDNKTKMVEETQKNIDNVKTIYNATFHYKHIIIIIDVLTIDQDGVSIYGIESTKSIHDIHLHKIALQYYVLEKVGYQIKSANIIHINSLYKRDDILELEKLFNIENITDEIIQIEKYTHNSIDEFTSLLEDKINEPSIDIGKHCEFPNSCEAKEYCWNIQRGIPDYSIFNIFNLGSKKQRQLYSKGIVDIKDIPKKFSLTFKQKQAIEHHNLETTYIDKTSIKSFLNTLNYPIYHFSCKTFHHVIPSFSQNTPYEEIPFQYSLHIEHKDGTVEHKEYLSHNGINPRYELTKRLCEDIPMDVTVLTYDMGNEQNIIKTLAYPYNGRTSHLLAIYNNMIDLMYPFKQKSFVSVETKGSYNKKDVIQSLVPEIAEQYKQLDEVNTQNKVQYSFFGTDSISECDKQNIRSSLMEYCKLDTLSMVKILAKLKEV